MLMAKHHHVNETSIAVLMNRVSIYIENIFPPIGGFFVALE